MGGDGMHLHDPRKPHEEQAVHAERCESGTKHAPQRKKRNSTPPPAIHHASSTRSFGDRGGKRWWASAYPLASPH